MTARLRDAEDTVEQAHGSTLKYRSVDSGLVWPSTAEMVGNGTDARSNLVAALCRNSRVLPSTSVTPARRNTVVITRCTVA